MISRIRRVLKRLRWWRNDMGVIIAVYRIIIMLIVIAVLALLFI